MLVIANIILILVFIGLLYSQINDNIKSRRTVYHSKIEEFTLSGVSISWLKMGLYFSISVLHFFHLKDQESSSDTIKIMGFLIPLLTVLIIFVDLAIQIFYQRNKVIITENEIVYSGAETIAIKTKSIDNISLNRANNEISIEGDHRFTLTANQLKKGKLKKLLSYIKEQRVKEGIAYSDDLEEIIMKINRSRL